jgi:hypothetical protein
MVKEFNNLTPFTINFYRYKRVNYIVKEIKQYQKKWLQHIQRMDTKRIPKQELQYKSGNNT